MTMNIEPASTDFTTPGTIQNESLEEKKRKLTLKLPNIEIGSNPSSNSMSSNDSSIDFNSIGSQPKKFRSLNGFIPLNNNNNDILSNLDLPTPHIEKLMADFNASSNTVLRTPGGLEIFTPSLENSFPLASSTTLNTPRNLLTPNDSATKTIHNFLAVNHFMDMSQDKSGTQTPNSTLINPLNIFGATNLFHSDNQSQMHENDNNTPKYSNLTNVTQNTGYIIQSLTPLTNSNMNQHITNSISSNGEPSSQPNHLFLNPNGTLKKDEPQTVPVHSNTLLLNRLQNGKKKSPSAKIKTINEMSAQSSSYSGEMKREPVVMTNLETVGAISNRRNTDKSTSSIGDGLSPFNYADQEDLKLEKKRERNREAARKCRTRKLQKIADLEQKVKILTDTNNEQRNKNKALMDEINEIKLKLQTHQKAHNCDLKLDMYSS